MEQENNYLKRTIAAVAVSLAAITGLNIAKEYITNATTIYDPHEICIRTDLPNGGTEEICKTALYRSAFGSEGIVVVNSLKLDSTGKPISGEVLDPETGGSISQTYDNRGRIKSELLDNDGDGNYEIRAELSYDNYGDVSKIELDVDNDGTIDEVIESNCSGNNLDGRITL